MKTIEVIKKSKSIAVYFLVVLISVILIITERPVYGQIQWSKHVVDKNQDGPLDISVTDMDGDKDPDIIITGVYSNDIIWYASPWWTEMDQTYH